jgi:crossover junction endodeoxyribonuclease RusA
MQFEIPFPLSVNQYWRTYQGRILISETGRLFRSKMKAHIHELMYKKLAKKVEGKLKVEFLVSRPDNRRRDLDNLLKVTLDVMTHAGVWDDDSQIQDLRIRWREPGDTVTVIIEEIP